MAEINMNISRSMLSWQFLMACIINILSLALPIMLLQVYDRIIPHHAYGTMLLLASGVLVALACDGFLRMARSYLAAYTAMQQEYDAGNQAMQIFLNSDIRAFRKRTTGTHLQNMMALGKLREFYSGQALMALVDFPFAFMFLGLIAYLGHELVLVPVAVLAVFMLTARFAGSNLRQALEQRSQCDDRKSSFIVSVLTAIHTVKSIGAERMLQRRFEKTQEDVTGNSYQVARASGSSALLSASFGQITLIMTATFGAYLVVSGQMSVGGLSACTLLAGRTIQPVQRILGAWLRLQDLAVSRVHADALMTLPVMERETNPLMTQPGHIQMNRVDYAYEDEKILENINLNVERGEMIAIEGGKGSGKSTLLYMMAGLLQPTCGHVRVNGIDPSLYQGSDNGFHIGYMPQQGAIFKGTILDNLTGFQDDEASGERAREAAAELGLDQVINQLPRGYQTQLNDSPSDPIPPGVKQRIALARILARRPQVILFDDADRTLDKEGYNRLFRYIGTKKGTVTFILVSHDQNLLSFADRRYYLDQGTLWVQPEQNTHQVSFLAKSFQREAS